MTAKPPATQVILNPALPDPVPPHQSPGAKPGKKAPPNPTIIGATDIPTTPLTLMGPGALGAGQGNKFLG